MELEFEPRSPVYTVQELKGWCNYFFNCVRQIKFKETEYQPRAKLAQGNFPQGLTLSPQGDT